MSDEDALLRALRAAPEDTTLRLAFADWLDERGQAGADYFRAEVVLAGASSEDAPAARRELLKCLLALPADLRNRFAQPDLLLAPPVPFRTGWYSERATRAKPYHQLSNLDPVAFDPAMPWLSVDGVAPRLDQSEHEYEELAALAELQRRANELRLVLPVGFEVFARDFPRRNAVSSGYCEMCLHDAVVNDAFPRVGEGYLVLFFADMDYGNPHQLAWSLYLVPEVDWHCVVAFELADDADNLLPDDPAVLFYCAPSFQSFLYRWCHTSRR